MIGTRPAGEEARRRLGVLGERLDWNLLRTFLCIARERSVSRAAARLHLSQPAVSQALKRLEQRLGGRLIHRSGNEFRLTALGEEVEAIAREVHAQVVRLELAADPRRDDIAGPMRLLVMSRIQSGAYDSFLADFHRRYPLIELHVEVMPSSEILDVLGQGAPALGISLCRNPRQRLERRLFLNQRYILVCGRHHPLHGRRGVGPGDLLDENFVSFTSDQIGDSLSPLTIFRDQRGFTGRIVASSSNIEEIRRLVIAGFGISCLPEHLVREDIAAGVLWPLMPDEAVAEIEVFLLRHGSRRLALTERAFLEAFERFLERVPMSARLG
ncbi:LysR family transcriptional regulator [Halotalea alkalilenta]|uniref:LysR family transcriptional regulator n=1 Tax=Halotalea alkalilenta TaxID=376489 RepID=UPI001B7FF0EF|nr:LysR family transcriptional regulator [Halotalea alkalilenta]